MNEIIGGYLDKYTYEYILERALARIPSDVDKRQGSIIFDALSPACYELAMGYADLKLVLQRAYAVTADGIYLDYRANERGIYRELATHAIKKAIFKDSNGAYMNVPLGSKFKTITVEGGILYTTKENLKDPSTGIDIVGQFKLKCDEAGIIGNTYTGELLSLEYINGLTEATMEDLITAGSNEEDDVSLYTRYEAKINEPPFGGNFSNYKENVAAIDGVGQVQVYPTWNGGGTVKISATDSQNEPLSAEKINEITKYLDPPNASGEKGDGLGLAPIGHRVTVVTPTKLTVDVDVTLVLLPGWTIGQVVANVQTNITKYFESLVDNWGREQNELKTYSTIIYRTNIAAYTLQVAGIATVSQVLLNNVNADIILEESSAVQQIPALGVMNVHT